ncbi:MAG: arylsulfatase [Planctomycetota bacterium]
MNGEKRKIEGLTRRGFLRSTGWFAGGALALAASGPLASVARGQRRQKRPNILLVVVDDMGYSDLGCFGGEIRTPTIDTLARSGLRLTSFYAAPTCAPSRCMLMSGTDNHLAGLGTQKEAMAPNQIGKPGYEGHINNRVVSIATRLRDAGYHTYMAGKWHLGTEVEHDPFNRGFEKAYALLQGGASHFDDEWMMCANYTPIYREDGVRTHVPRGFFSSEFYTNKVIEYIDSAKDDKPFFCYLALTAPHDPLHLPDEWLHRCKGRYDAGYDALRTERLKRMKKLGIVPKDTELSHPPAMVPKWDSLKKEQKRFMARRMELHAGMVENLDHHLDRVIEHLKAKGVYDNTLIIFYSDNGAAPTEFHNYPGTTKEWVERNSDNRYENMGKRGSRISIGMAWSLAGNTPLRYFKGFHSEGGMRVPCIVAGPGVGRKGQIDSAFTHVMDIAPTLLEAAGVSASGAQYKGRQVLPLMGKSMVPFLTGKNDKVRDDDEYVGWEQFSRAVRQGRWKATWIMSPFGTDDWQLYDLETDISERNDLAETKPEKLWELIRRWEEYADEVDVVLPSTTIQLAD